MDNTSQVYYYHADALGSIAALTSSSGSVAQTYAYDAFGNITGTPSITQPYTYTAREYDSETGLYFYRARYYDSKAGRFLTRDPIGFKGGVNQYTYVKNRPVNRTDPFGLQEWELPDTGPSENTDTGSAVSICRIGCEFQHLADSWSCSYNAHERHQTYDQDYPFYFRSWYRDVIDQYEGCNLKAKQDYDECVQKKCKKECN